MLARTGIVVTPAQMSATNRASGYRSDLIAVPLGPNGTRRPRSSVLE
jgi:hypothetical protein